MKQGNEMEESKIIQGKVARILNSRQLVLNIGRNKNVGKGMIFKIVDDSGEDIVDPESGEELGSIYITKILVEITSVDEKLSVATTFKKNRKNIGGNFESAGSSLHRLLTPPKYVDVYETFASKELNFEGISEDDCFIEVGDDAIQIIGQEKKDSESVPDSRTSI